LVNSKTSSAIANFSLFERTLFFSSRNWLLLFGVLFGIYVLLPFLAPLLMVSGWIGPGKAIYTIYSFLCHQLPERSYFLFGPKISYAIPEIQAAWKNSLNPMILRQFIGNPAMGWKVAWSDRMVSMYLSTWLFGLIWWPLRKRLRPLPWWGLLLFLLPMAIDGTSHFISDLSGIGQGFRDSNRWLVQLTGHILPPIFFIGDAWGSFNAWMRLLTGVFFGMGIVWFGFPFVDQAFTDTAQSLQNKAKRLAACQSKLDEGYQMLARTGQESSEYKHQ
jgi:uncharacterized membrane protein